MSDDLSPSEDKLVEYMRRRGHQVDVRIIDMYGILRGEIIKDVTYAQAYLGPFISKANKKLKMERIVPGEVKKTYRLEKYIEVV